MSENKDARERLDAIQKQLGSLSKQLNNIKDMLIAEFETLSPMRERIARVKSRTLFYVGIFVGIFTGLIGNFFVSLWFQKVTPWTVLGLIISGLVLLLMGAIVWLKIGQHASGEMKIYNEILTEILEQMKRNET